MNMEIKDIISLMKEMEQSSLSGFELELDGVKLKLEKAPVAEKELSITSIQAPVIEHIENKLEKKVIEKEHSIDHDKTEKCEVTGQKIISPMVGTFYTKASPEKEPFVKVGDEVKKGQTLCIIEAMKLMNDIECEYDGKVVDILCENEQMVEYGQPLFVIG